MMKTTENNQNRANSMINVNHPNNNNQKINHESENEKTKESAGLEFNRSHSSANLNSFFENYVNASKSNHDVMPTNEAKDQNLDNNNNKKEEEKKEANTMNVEPMESELSQKNDGPFSDRNDETDTEKAEGYVSAMDNIIKMTSVNIF